VSDFLFKDRDGQTPLPPELHKGLKIKTIQTVGELDEHEEDNIAKGLNWLSKQKANPCKYDFWLKLHKKLFENVWSWAGKIRTHELANPDFKMPHDIWPQLYQLEIDLETWIADTSLSRQELAARFHERIETIHPFANGNGRFGRIITEQICKYQLQEVPTWGLKLRHDPAKRRTVYIAALTQARRTGNYAALISLMFT
jgi:Fic-DOC domain mobile mystery protein B